MEIDDYINKQSTFFMVKPLAEGIYSIPPIKFWNKRGNVPLMVNDAKYSPPVTEMYAIQPPPPIKFWNKRGNVPLTVNDAEHSPPVTGIYAIPPIKSWQKKGNTNDY